jgi:mono/diheme cytochrome c family protein
MLAAGSCTLTASQPGNASFAAATAKTIAFSIIDPSAPVVPPVGVIPVASNGKVLYASRCSGCHGQAAAGGSKVLNGANSAMTILWAINNNRGGMSTLQSLTQQNLADIAAFLATPNM